MNTLASAIIGTLGSLAAFLSASAWRIHHRNAITHPVSSPSRNITTAHWQTDATNTLIEPSANLRTLLPPHPQDRSLGILLSGTPHPTAEGSPLQTLLDDHAAFENHLTCVRIRNDERWLRLSGTPHLSRTGTFKGFEGTVQNVTPIIDAYRRAQLRQREDPLTGLPIRHALLDLATPLIETETPFALVVVGFKGFQTINMEMGRDIGDWLIKTTVARIHAVLPPGTLFGRLGGNSYSVLFTHPTHPPEDLVRPVLDAIAAPCIIEGVRTSLDTRCGIALYPEHGNTPAQLMHQADLALATAYERDTRRPVLFSTALKGSFLDRIRLGAELEAAIRLEEIEIVFQPIFNTTTNRPISAEALLRWPQPDRKTLSPADIIALAESAGHMVALGRYILSDACHKAVTWPSSLPVAVNVSPTQLRMGGFLDTLKATLAASGLPPTRLTLEVTESVFLETSTSLQAELADIRALGVRLVLDDFGTGYSSLTYLRDFVADGVKLDAGFIRDLPHAPRVCTIVATIANLASTLGMTLVAEGVENTQQRDWLHAHGILHQQGFLFATPQREEELQKLLTPETIHVI